MKSLLYLILVVCSFVHGDTWPLPAPMGVVSSNAEYMVRIMPGVEGKKAEAFLYKFVNNERGYQLLTKRTLENETLPVTVHISSTGKYLVTFDDYGGTGHGENVLVIYDLDTGETDKFSLEQITKTLGVNNAFEESVSSVLWRRSTGLMVHDESIVAIVFNQKNKNGDHLACRYDIKKKAFIHKEYIQHSR